MGEEQQPASPDGRVTASQAAAAAAQAFPRPQRLSNDAADSSASSGFSTESDDYGASYEVAREVLGHLMGYAATRIDAERAKDHPDEPTVEAWQQRQRDWSARWHALDPRDQAAVQKVLDDDAAFLRTLPTDA